MNYVIRAAAATAKQTSDYDVAAKSFVLFINIVISINCRNWSVSDFIAV